MPDLREMAREHRETIFGTILSGYAAGDVDYAAASFAEKVLRRALDLGESWDTMQDLKAAIRREFGL